MGFTMLCKNSFFFLSRRMVGPLEQVIYNDLFVKKYKDTEFGPTVIHEYVVRFRILLQQIKQLTS